jgi:nucleoid DNA-binding protein
MDGTQHLELSPIELLEKLAADVEEWQQEHLVYMLAPRAEITEDEAALHIAHLLNLIQQALEQNEDVTLGDFGKFALATFPAVTLTGLDDVKQSKRERRTVTFQARRGLNQALNKLRK